jgi:dTDP-4-amino-4,6-dideoxygalactose transaminase
MAVTADEDLHRRMLAIRQHGQERPGSNVHQGFGLNYRPSEIHALLGLRMLRKAGWILSQRRHLALGYDRLLAGGPVRPVVPFDGLRPAYYKYMAILPDGADRDGLKKRMGEEFGVALAGEVYSTPGHLQPVWKNRPDYLASPIVPLPNSERWAGTHVCFPLYPNLSSEAQECVVDALKCVLG